jgi:hypothetical protein
MDPVQPILKLQLQILLHTLVDQFREKKPKINFASRQVLKLALLINLLSFLQALVQVLPILRQMEFVE